MTTLTFTRSFTIKYFASVREAVNCAEETLPWQASLNTVDAVKAELQRRGEPWQTALAKPQLRCAVNQTLTAFHQAVSAGDEVAFFPPVTGG